MNKFPWVQYSSTLLFYIVILGVIMLLGGAYSYFYPSTTNNQDQQTQVQNLQIQQQTQAIYREVLSAVGKLIVLPNAIPEISVINDVQAFVAQNPVFAGSSRGDIVLIYPELVVVYSPQLNRIIHSQKITPTPSNLTGTNQDVQSAPVPTPVPAGIPAPEAQTEQSDGSVPENQEIQ